MRTDTLADNSVVRPISIAAVSLNRSGKIATATHPRGLVVALHCSSYATQRFDSPNQSIVGVIAKPEDTVVCIDRAGYEKRSNRLPLSKVHRDSWNNQIK
jgi:hypothetical protein